MITITEAAADQIRKSAEQSDAAGMALRIAATVEEDGSIQYGMGFDQQGENDVLVSSQGIDVLIADNFKELLMGTTLDYVELNPGEFQFIFYNPNDPSHVAPGKDAGLPH
jgi:iron-sulfur cluster assembly protein